MRMLLIVTVACMFFCNSVSFAATTEKEKQALREAMDLIELFMWNYENVTLLPLPDFIGEDVEESCRVTQPEVETIIREYTLKYDGSITRDHLTHTMMQLVVAFGLYADELHDHDGKVTQVEVRALTLGARESTAMVFLFCLFDAYLKK